MKPQIPFPTYLQSGPWDPVSYLTSLPSSSLLPSQRDDPSCFHHVPVLPALHCESFKSLFDGISVYSVASICLNARCLKENISIRAYINPTHMCNTSQLPNTFLRTSSWRSVHGRDGDKQKSKRKVHIPSGLRGTEKFVTLVRDVCGPSELSFCGIVAAGLRCQHFPY